MSVSIADLKLPTESEKIKLNINRRGGRFHRPICNEETQEKTSFLLRFFICLPHTRHPCGGALYCRVRAKVFWSSQNLFLKKGSERCEGLRLDGAPGRASHILSGARGSAPAEPRIYREGDHPFRCKVEQKSCFPRKNSSFRAS